MKLTLVLPAFNEETSLPALLDAVRRTFVRMTAECRVLVVDDGSTDHTVALAKSYADRLTVQVYEHGVNKGLGAGLLNGLRESMKDLGREDVVITMDADNTHDPSLIPAMLDKMADGCDVVIASRYAPGGDELGLTPLRKVLSRGASTFLKLFFSLPGARDCSCGYRAYRASLLERAFGAYGDRLVEETGFVCMAELLVKLAIIGARIGEVPLILRYDLKGGASKMNIRRTVGQYFQLARRKQDILRMSGCG